VPERSLRQQTLSGVKWMTLARVVAETAAFASSVVLARLISPQEFGFTAAAVFITMLAAAVSQQSVGAFLVQAKAPTERHVQAASLAALALGATGTVLTLGFAFGLAAPLFGDRAARFTVLCSPVWVLAGLAVVPLSQLQRRLDFARLGGIQAIASVANPMTAVALALAGLGGEAVVIGGVAGAAVTAAMGSALSRPPWPAWHRAELREIFAFGSPAAGSSIFYAAVRNIDYLLLAAFIPAFQVGLYMRAFALGSDSQGKISQVLLNVAFPVLSRTKDPDGLRRLRARMIRVHATVLFPLLFGLIAVAPEFVPWLYGATWTEAGPLTQILAVGGMIAAVGTGTGPLLMAAGQPRALLAYNVTGFVAYTLAVLAAIPFGLTAVCIAIVIVRATTFVAMQYFVVERRVGIPVLETVRDDVVPAVTCGLPQLAITWLVLHISLDAGLPVAPAIAVAGVAGLAVYMLLMRRHFRATWADVTMLFGRLLPARVSRTPAQQQV
jgi:O-antigen/teichoic acid export membrane protein